MQAECILGSACNFSREYILESIYAKFEMSNKTSSTRLESGKDDARINALVEKLRIKLKNFAVLDRQGELIGEVKDLILDINRQLNLVVSQAATGSYRVFLLSSKIIQKIDPPNKSVLVDINKAQMNNLPEYVNTETPGMELSEMPNSSGTPPHEATDEGTTQNRDVYINLQETLEETTPTEYADISGVPASAIPTPSSELQNIQNELDDRSVLESLETPQVLEEEIIRLLEERLVVDRSKRKVGEVIVRKEIETRMVQVPVRREKLIVEQVSPERKQLAEIDLGQEEIPEVELLASAISETEIASLDSGLTVRGEFNSPKIASLLLNAIALERRHGCKKVRVQIVVEDAERQKTYQEWVDRSSGSQQSQPGK